MRDAERGEIRAFAIITSNFPARAQPTHGTFVAEFAKAIARQRVRCTVIHPTALHRALRNPAGYPAMEVVEAGAGADLIVYRPRFLSLSARPWFTRLGPLNPAQVTFWRFAAAAERVLRNMEHRPDAVYGHFLFQAGASAVRVGRRLGIPAFPGIGEGELWTLRPLGVERARRELEGATGFIVNSTALKELVSDVLRMPTDRFAVFPNGVDLERFSPLDRAESRKALGFPQDRFLVASVGNFLEKKGVVRVGEALDGIADMGGVYAGSGPMPPEADNTVFQGRIPHDQIPVLLSACDAFALPTQVEGSCNALVEAMACGLPVVSSKGRFNDDILTDEAAIRIDPLDVSALRAALIRLKQDGALRGRMGAAARRQAENLDVNRRAADVLEFISSRVEGGNLPAGKAL